MAYIAPNALREGIMDYNNIPPYALREGNMVCCLCTII